MAHAQAWVSGTPTAQAAYLPRAAALYPAIPGVGVEAAAPALVQQQAAQVPFQVIRPQLPVMVPSGPQVAMCPQIGTEGGVGVSMGVQVAVCPEGGALLGGAVATAGSAGVESGGPRAGR